MLYHSLCVCVFCCDLQGSKRVVMVDSLSRFAEYIETSELNLPSSTVAFEEEGTVSWNTIKKFNIEGKEHRGFPIPGG